MFRFLSMTVLSYCFFYFLPFGSMFFLFWSSLSAVLSEFQPYGGKFLVQHKRDYVDVFRSSENQHRKPIGAHDRVQGSRQTPPTLGNLEYPLRISIQWTCMDSWATSVYQEFVFHAHRASGRGPKPRHVDTRVIESPLLIRVWWREKEITTVGGEFFLPLVAPPSSK